MDEVIKEINFLIDYNKTLEKTFQVRKLQNIKLKLINLKTF